jgi:UDP-4-amino-4,6-dideoxy-N-acetyl-beta-L-altrosamine transaminase
MIPYGRHDINKEDIDAVVSVLQSDYLTQGDLVPKFEAAFVDYCGAKHAVAVNSATSALHIACLALELGTGDWLWTSPITFVASANCGRYCGAQVDFVDIDPQTYNISVNQLAAKLESAEKAGLLPKVLVPVHLCGQSCDMAAIYALSQQYGFKIIEDASHAIGGRYQNEAIGNCRYSDITVFSFHPVKIITTAEGGMAMTNKAELAQKMSRLRSHGITRNAEEMTIVPDGHWYYQQIELGYNYRLTELQAALGISQMTRLDEFVSRRHNLAKRYDEMLSDLPLVTPWQHPDCYSALHLYVIRLQLNKISKTHKQVFSELLAKGIGVNLHYIPLHTQPYYSRQGLEASVFCEASRYYSEAISLPIFPGLSEADQSHIVDTLKIVLTS